uniref:Alpha-ketoglutarate-dependent dioxygenase AlkB-like domain-containing protein n=1 Tax=Octactis speculum TaxID=3111310 RepID=A0A7S2MT58_9STRA|mmetsp:Transcript_9597/g.12500  ORF Transcript_9597/g.12500 Transcript_9597/m.12500 type:complete len:193 (+) Transcript_9597:71-649(+)
MGRWHSANKRFEIWGDPVGDFLNHEMAAAVSAMAGVQVVPTYPWPVEYAEGGTIGMHVDQTDNELSLSYSIETIMVEPNIPKKSSGPTQNEKEDAAATATGAATAADWPLYFVGTGSKVLQPGEPSPANLDLDPKAVRRATRSPVVLGENDGVLYRGRDMVHWRPPGPPNQRLRQLVFAWRSVHEDACLGSL